MKTQLLGLAAALLFTARALGQGAVLLVGGGSENYGDWSDAPYRWLVERAGGGPLLILHYAEGSTFLPGYFKSLGASEVSNWVIASRASANDSATYRALQRARGVFLRGGDQWRYLELWRGTLAQQALRQVFDHGGVVGGTSAGAMVLSEVVFDARLASVDPRAALRDPLRAGITLSDDFLALVPGVLVDTHFYERGRLGRLLAMLAVSRDQRGRWIMGLGVDDRTALAILPDGTAEVMGSGVVTLLRATAATTHTVQTGAPLALAPLQLLQMTAGFRVDLAGGEVLARPAESVPLTPATAGFSVPAMDLEGSERNADWFSPAGSLTALVQQFAAGSDTVGLVCGVGGLQTAAELAGRLQQDGIRAAVLSVEGGSKNDPVLAQQVGRRAGFVFVANHADSVAAFLSAATRVGDVLRQRLAAGTLAVFLGNDSKLAGTAVVGQTEVSTTAAYRGRLALWPGLDLSRGVVVMPRVFESSDYYENRTSGLFWGMAKAAASYGLLLDAGTHLRLSGARGEVHGSTPALVVDARRAQWTAFSSYRASGGVGPRQSAALVTAEISVVPAGRSFDFDTGVVVAVATAPPNSPPAVTSLHNHPNPFNPTTTFSYHLPHAQHVLLRVHDLQGRVVATLVDARQESGAYQVVFDAVSLASGIYFARLQAGGLVLARKLMLVR